MATVYESIVRVHCDSQKGASRAEVFDGVQTELAKGQFLFRLEADPAVFTVTAQVIADDSSIAQREAAHVVSEALIRAGVESGTHIEDTEIRAG